MERGYTTQDEDALHLPSCLLTLLSFLLKDSSSCVVYRRVAFTPVGRSLPAAPRMERVNGGLRKGGRVSSPSLSLIRLSSHLRPVGIDEMRPER